MTGKISLRLREIIQGIMFQKEWVVLLTFASQNVIQIPGSRKSFKSIKNMFGTWLLTFEKEIAIYNDYPIWEYN